jgi:hypothetical protein
MYLSSLSQIIGGFLPEVQKQNGLEPLLFGFFYFGSIPLFMIAEAWLVRNIIEKAPLLFPGVLTVILLTVSYVFLTASGIAIPALLILFLASLAAFGLGSAWSALSHRMPKITQRKLPKRRGRP